MRCLILLAASCSLFLTPATAVAAPVPGVALRAELPVGTAVIVLLNDGKVYKGTIKKQDADSITLETETDNQKKEVKVQRADIEEIRKHP